MAEIIISQLPPAPNETGTGTPLGTDLFPATDITDTSSAPTGTTKKYTRAVGVQYDIQSLGFPTVAAVTAATTVALTVTYANGTAGVGATLTNAGAQAAFSLDGVTLAVGQRVLIKNQASQLQNGIYSITTLGSGSTNWILTRTTDYDTPAQVIQGQLVLVTQGTTNAGLQFQETGAGPFTIGTTAITYAAQSFTGSGAFVLENSPNIITPTIIDPNNNNLLTFSYNASAVNYINITNNSTTNAPSVSAVGTDANITLNLFAKGTASVYLATLGSTVGVTNGTGYQHVTLLSFPTTAATRTVTFPDNTGSVPIIANTSIPTNGEIPIGNGTNYTAATLTAGAGIAISNGAGSITISSSGSSGWVNQTTSSVTMAVNTGYTVNDGASLVTLTLPATAAIGDFVEINGQSSGGWSIAQAAGQTIEVSNTATTTGTMGSLSSAHQYDNVRLRCIVANTTWTVVSQQSAGLTIV